MDSKSCQRIVPAVHLGGGRRWFFSLKSPTFRFWHWGSSNILHPSVCFSCYVSKRENKPKGKPKHMLPPAQPLVFGRDQGREECVSWGRGALMALRRAVQGCRMHIQRKPPSASSASCRTVFFSIWLAPTSSRKSLVLVVAGSLQLLQKQKVLRYSVMPCFLIAANAYVLNFRVTLFSSEVIREYLLHLGHPLEGVVIMF